MKSMRFSNSDIENWSSLSYPEYIEKSQKYECRDCGAITVPHEMTTVSAMPYCKRCRRFNLKSLFPICDECQTPIEYKTDYFLDNDEVSALPQVYLLCGCSRGIWFPLIKESIDGIIGVREDGEEDDFSPMAVDAPLPIVRLTESRYWYLFNPSPSKYANNVNSSVHFTKCQKSEQDHFLHSYIKANIDPCQRMGGELESFSKDYYKLCVDTINLNLKLGLLNIFLPHQMGYYMVNLNLRLENPIHDLVQYSNPIFWQDYVRTYFDSCVMGISRLMEESPEEYTNSYRAYAKRYTDCYYPERKDKSGISRPDPRLSRVIEIRNWYIAHDDIRFDTATLHEGITDLVDIYKDQILTSINTLNKMQRLKIVFSYDPHEIFINKGVALPILKIIDNELSREHPHPESEMV